MAILLIGNEFDENKACIVCQHVIAGNPVLGIYYDDDADLQFSCGADQHDGEEWIALQLQDIVGEHDEILMAPNLEIGQIAERLTTNADWTVYTD